jgi:parvulin-like peptidyl-prolyl isomerase
MSEEKFAEYARGNSEDAATAKAGGVLAKPFRKDPNKPNALYDRMVDLPVGAVTDVVIKYAGSYYIMRRGEEVQKTFDDATKNELRVSLQNRRAYAVAAQLAQRAAEKLKQTKDYTAVARELAAEANMKPEDMVRDTPFVKPGDDVPNIGSSQQFEQGIAPLENANDVGERTPVKGGFAIPMLLEKRDPRIPEFDEVKDRAAQAYKQEQARQRVEQTARDLAANTGAASELKAAAERAGLEAKDQADYKLSDPLGEAGTSPALDDAIYALQAGQVHKSALKVGENWVVVGLTKRSEADLAKFASQRDQLMQTALSERRNQVFDDYVNAIQVRMQREGKIKIYEDVLARIADSADAAAPAPRPRIPIPTK